MFRSDALNYHSFGMDFTLIGQEFTIERTGSDQGKIFIEQGIDSNLLPSPKKDKKSGRLYITNNDWKDVLGSQLFGLGSIVGAGKKYHPTFRSLISYLIRRQNAGAFQSPFKQFSRQYTWDQQVNLSYLIGLDWMLSADWQAVRDQEKGLQELLKAAKSGTFGEIVQTTAALRTKIAVATEERGTLASSISSFRVLPEYTKYESEAADLSRRLADLANGNAIDVEIIEQAKRSLEEESAPDVSTLDRVYKSVGIELPNTSVRRFDEVARFHRSVVENRRSYLEGEIEESSRRIEKRRKEQANLDERRARVMSILRNHGAISQLAELQSELSRLDAEIEGLKQQYDLADQLESEKVELEVERRNLLIQLQRDFKEREEILDRAIVVFEKLSTALYEEAGSLVMEPTPNGPEFRVVIQGASSKGVTNMQIFCIDQMIMALWSGRDKRPTVLVHDSHLFDGVDERQVATALQLGAERARDMNYQYIVTMNSDVLSEDTIESLGIKESVVDERLTDETESGGLFGIRFG